METAAAISGKQQAYQWTRVRGVLLRSFGAVFQGLSGIMGLGGFMLAIRGGAIGGVLFVLIVVPISVGLNWIATKLAHHGRRQMARSAYQLMALDPRPPVVYLRAFSADEVAADVDYKTAMGGLRFGTTTHEERLRNAFNRIGPVVALAEPGEEEPDLGAARLKADNAEWMSTISNLFQGAQLIVMRAGESPGLLWELEYVVKQSTPERFIVLVGNDVDYEQFRSATASLLPVPLPELPRRPETEKKKKKEPPPLPAGGLSWLMRFGDGWEPEVERVTILWDSLKPVFARLNVEPKLPPVIRRANWISAFILTLGILGAIAILIGILVFLNYYWF